MLFNNSYTCVFYSPNKKLSLPNKNFYTMCKINTFILLLATFCSFSADIFSQNADIELLHRLNSDTKISSGYFYVISETTNPVSVAVPLATGLIGLIKQDDDMIKNAVYVTAAMGLNTVLTLGAKEIIQRPRPYNTYPNLNNYRNLGSYAFPSGHTSIAFTTATAISLAYPEWYIIVPSFAWAASVGYSRMYLGVHYPSDVLVGALLGSGCAYLSYKVNQWYWKKNKEKKIIHFNAL